jgi:ADP-ribose pyrophosphatase YjhB (NUDIX family)
VAVIVRDGRGRVLLGRRADGRRAGLWCIPCGRLEWGEDVREAAVREFGEETGLEVVLEGVYDVHSNFHDPDRLTVGVWFSGRVTGGTLHAADGELSELGWFEPGDPPPLAFQTDALVLQRLTREGFGQ